MSVKRLLAGRRHTKSNTHGNDVGVSRIIAHGFVQRFEQTGISIGAMNRRDVRIQCKYCLLLIT